jgi:hypothetical protein
MKKYIKPSVEVIEMETAQVIADSDGRNTMSLSDTETTSVYESRNRGAAWTDYEGE